MAILGAAAEGTIKIPREMMRECDLHEGEDVELFAEGNTIRIVPTVTYPDEYLDTIEAELEEFHKLNAQGKIPVYDNIDDLMDALNNDADD